MGILSRIKGTFTPKPYPVAELGLEPLPFFIALLRACPPGSQLTFDRSEPESFVRAFRKWSHRSDSGAFEAAWYRIDTDFITLAQELARRGELELYCHFGIIAPEGRLLCASWDDFTIVKLADDLRVRIPRHAL